MHYSRRTLAIVLVVFSEDSAVQFAVHNETGCLHCVSCFDGVARATET